MINICVYIELITKTLRTIYVEREDPQSRVKAAEEIRRRTHTRGEWPKVLIFPEGIQMHDVIQVLVHTVSMQLTDYISFFSLLII